MLKFNKASNSKIVSLLVAILFLLNSPVYGIDTSSKSHLRPPALRNSGKEGTLAAMLNLEGLTPQQHDLLNRALGTFFEEGYIEALTYADLAAIDPDSHLRELYLDKNQELKVYRFTKERLEDALREVGASQKDIAYITTNLISHPGRFRNEKGNPRATNLFILKEHYNLLVQLDHDLKVQWAKHERAHLDDITRSEEEIQAEFPLNNVVEALSEVHPRTIFGVTTQKTQEDFPDFATQYSSLPDNKSRIEFLLEHYPMPGVKIDVISLPPSPFVPKGTGRAEEIGPNHYKITLFAVEGSYEEYLLFHEFMHFWLGENGFSLGWDTENADVANYVFNLRNLVNDYLIEKETRRRFGNYYSGITRDLSDFDLTNQFNFMAGEEGSDNISIFMLALTCKAVSTLYPELSDSVSARVVGDVLQGDALMEVISEITNISINDSIIEYRETVRKIHRLLIEEDAEFKDETILVDTTSVVQFTDQINTLMAQIAEFNRIRRQQGRQEVSASNISTTSEGLFTAIKSQDKEFQVSSVDMEILKDIDFDKNISIFIAQDIFNNPVGFIESWEKFGRPGINVLAQDKEQRKQVETLKSIGLIPQGAEVILIGELFSRLEGKQGILFAFEKSIPKGLPENIHKFKFVEFQKDKGKVLNWERVFMFLLYRLGIRVEYDKLPQEKPFTESDLDSLISGEVLYTDIPVGVKVSEGVQRTYQTFRETVCGL